MTRVNSASASLQRPSSSRATSEPVRSEVFAEQLAQLIRALAVDRVEVDQLVVGARGELAVGVVDEGDAAAHPGAEVLARRADHDDDTAGHVLAGVLADALDDGLRAGVADRETLTDGPLKKARPRVAP